MFLALAPHKWGRVKALKKYTYIVHSSILLTIHSPRRNQPAVTTLQYLHVWKCAPNFARVRVSPVTLTKDAIRSRGANIFKTWLLIETSITGVFCLLIGADSWENVGSVPDTQTIQNRPPQSFCKHCGTLRQAWCRICVKFMVEFERIYYSLVHQMAFWLFLLLHKRPKHLKGGPSKLNPKTLKFYLTDERSNAKTDYFVGGTSQ